MNGEILLQLLEEKFGQNVALNSLRHREVGVFFVFRIIAQNPK